MSVDKIDAVIVGGGLAGLAAAYRLCSAGKQVILLERGDAPGAKNVTGGRMYVEPIRRLLPEIIDADDAPFERPVVKEIAVAMDDAASMLVEYTNDSWRRKPHKSYTVLRAGFDGWFASKVMDKGCFVIPKKRVDDLLWEDGRVAGVKALGEEIPAHILIAADGALSFTAQKAGLKNQGIPADYAVGIKELYKLDSAVIEDRFGLNPGEGAACLFMGAITKGVLGGGFLYTNKDSLSIGLVVGLGGLVEKTGSIESSKLMDEFIARSDIQRWIKGGELKEYSAHLISEAGMAGVSKLYGDGIMVTGDAAGLSLNMGLTVRGMEFAIASGVMAGEVAVNALDKGDTSAQFLSQYETKLKQSFVLRDMELFRHSREVLDNDRLFTVYPRFLCDLFRDFYTIDDGPKAPFFKTIKDISRKHLFNMATVKDLMSLRKV
jgi:electron transfer flavoprotein-quinone oxidoreductase